MSMLSRDNLVKMIVVLSMVAYGFVFLASLRPAIRNTQIEIATKLDPSFDGRAKLILLGQDPNVPVNTYSAPLNLSTGIGNATPFNAGE